MYGRRFVGIGRISISFGAVKLAIVSSCMIGRDVGTMGHCILSGALSNIVIILTWEKVSSSVSLNSQRRSSMSASYVSTFGSKLLAVANARRMIAFVASFASGVLLVRWSFPSTLASLGCAGYTVDTSTVDLSDCICLLCVHTVCICHTVYLLFVVGVVAVFV